MGGYLWSPVSNYFHMAFLLLLIFIPVFPIKQSCWKEWVKGFIQRCKQVAACVFVVIIICPTYFKRMCYHVSIRLKGMVSVVEKNYKSCKLKEMIKPI